MRGSGDRKPSSMYMTMQLTGNIFLTAQLARSFEGIPVIYGGIVLVI